MASLENATSLLALPTELREKIYKEVLTAPARSFGLLQVCREINTEAHKILYQRSLVFNSQICLYSWLASNSLENCSRVNDITVFVQDVDLRPLLRTYQISDMTASPPHLLNLDLYETELAKLRAAFEKLPKVATLTLRVLPFRQSFLYREFLARILILLSSTYPTLVELKVEGSMIYQSLEYLACFSKLKHFTFDGVTASSAAAMVEILKGMEHLQSLSMTSHQNIPTSMGLPYNTFTYKKKPGHNSFTRTLDFHGTFPSTEDRQDWSPKSTLTADILTGLRDHKTLREISIYYAQEPHPRTLRALQQVVGNAAISTLKLDWPEMRPKVLKDYALVDHIETLQLKPRAAPDAAAIMRYLWTRRSEGDLAKLRRLILTRTSEPSQSSASERKDSGIAILPDVVNCTEATSTTVPEAPDTHMIHYWKKRLEDSGVQVLWCTEVR